MTGTELMYWKATMRRNPFGPWRDNYNSAWAALAVARCHGNKNAMLEDFMWQTQGQKKVTETSKTLQAFLAMAKPKQKQSSD